MHDFIKPRLYLITPPVADAEAFAPALKAALEPKAEAHAAPAKPLA